MNIFKKLIALVVITMALVSCQFTETLVLNEDGTGTMAISMDLSEMMAFSGEMATKKGQYCTTSYGRAKKAEGYGEL